jgi:uncharacterized membrane protein YjgN (DUF898 family)
MATEGRTGAIAAFPLEFSGTGGEYFRVWIVNVLLTIVTLGFYTPFARRRTAQYFWGHTLVADSPLEFSVQQRRMVFGFLVLVALYIAFNVASDTGQDTVVALFMGVGALLAPYFWGSAMRFRLNATRWRGVRLQFTASWGEVYRAAWPIFVMALAWIAVVVFAGTFEPAEGQPPVEPAAAETFLLLGAALLAMLVSVVCLMRLEFNSKSLLVARGRIGGQPGRWKPMFGDFVRIWLATVGVFIASALVFAVVVALVVGGSVAGLSNVKQAGPAAAILAAVAGLFAFLFGLILSTAPARAYREARVFHLVWNNIGVSHVARFKCDLRVWRYVRLRILNLFLTLLTLGFYRPFALVSEYRMKAESVTLHVKGGLDQLAGQLAREEQGLGDAIADAVGLDLVG